MDSARDLRVRCQSVLAPVGVRCSRADRVRMVPPALRTNIFCVGFLNYPLICRRRTCDARMMQFERRRLEGALSSAVSLDLQGNVGHIKCPHGIF